MSYLAIYRRFRPNDFSNVVGQEHVVTTLINQIKTERIGHAYLFCGARGTGKTTVARIFAKAINCLNPVNGSPCGDCEVCQNLASPNNLDIIEIDAASNNKVDNVQEIRTNVQYPPVSGRYKVYIIDEVHMLTTEAFNALLKTLEEPPKHAVFILATTEPHKLPATILSRCMRFDFHLVSDKVIENLIEKIYDEVGKKYEKEAVSLIAKSGEGSIRDALSLADLCISYGDEKLTYKQVIDILGASDSSKTAALVTGILKGEVGQVLSVIEELCGLGKSVSVLTKDVLSMVRDVLVVKTCLGAQDILMLPKNEYDRLFEISELGDNHRFLRVLEIFTAIETDLRYSTHPRIVFEAAAVKASLPTEDYNMDALISRVNDLEKSVKNLLSGESAVLVSKPKDASQKIAVEVVETSQKPAYKPVNEQFNEKTEVVSVTDKEDTRPFVQKEEKRLSGFDYVSDDDVPPPIDDYMPPENQMSFYGYEEVKTAQKSDIESDNTTKQTPIATAVETSITPKISEEVNAKVMPQGVVRDRIPDARLWGTVIRKLRAEKHIMLWIACQELDAKVDGETLVILADGENEYNLLSKKESIEVLQSIVTPLAPYKVKIQGVDKDGGEEEKFKKDAEAVKEMFDGKVTIKG